MHLEDEEFLPSFSADRLSSEVPDCLQCPKQSFNAERSSCDNLTNCQPASILLLLLDLFNANHHVIQFILTEMFQHVNDFRFISHRRSGGAITFFRHPIIDTKP
jgi:hypothetical protein